MVAWHAAQPVQGLARRDSVKGGWRRDNRGMNLQKIFLPIVGAAMVVMAWQAYGWQGAALAGGALVMYLLLHFNRMMHVLKKAAERPKGYVASAVMLNAKLKPGVNLLHVMAMTESLGELLVARGRAAGDLPLDGWFAVARDLRIRERQAREMDALPPARARRGLAPRRVLKSSGSGDSDPKGQI